LGHRLDRDNGQHCISGPTRSARLRSSTTDCRSLLCSAAAATARSHPRYRQLNETPPSIAAYAGPKFALEGISESLRCELIAYSIDVIVVAPHSTSTALLDKAEAQDITRYELRRTSNRATVFWTLLYATDEKAITHDKSRNRYTKQYQQTSLARVTV
jgi:NAD(P)-dependent dehydrogenase (short-subunit alcohol dehydrogenase family)